MHCLHTESYPNQATASPCLCLFYADICHDFWHSSFKVRRLRNTVKPADTTTVYCNVNSTTCFSPTRHQVHQDYGYVNGHMGTEISISYNVHCKTNRITPHQLPFPHPITAHLQYAFGFYQDYMCHIILQQNSHEHLMWNI
jgi:hypothetical protein